MADISGVKLTINTDIQSRKAEELEQLVETMANKILEIDEAVGLLVHEAIEGDAVASLSKSYRDNRAVISHYIQQLSGTANLLYEDAQAKKRSAEQANIAAGGV